MNCRILLTRERICWGIDMMIRLWIYALIFICLPECCSGTTTSDATSVYRESVAHSNYQPPGCRRTIKPAYYLENTGDMYRLVVTIPEQVSRKKLKIDVDYEEGHVEVFGWWSEGGVRGAGYEEAKKMCIYGIWEIDSELLTEEAIVSSDLVSVYDIFMMIQDHQLILSVPIQEEPQIPTAVEDEEPQPPAPIASPIHMENDDDERIQQQKQQQQNTSIAVAYGTSLWKKFKGLVRVKDHAKVNYYHYSNERTFSMLSIPLQPPSILAYEKYRQDALEEFLAYALTITMDQTSMSN